MHAEVQICPSLHGRDVGVRRLSCDSRRFTASSSEEFRCQRENAAGPPRALSESVNTMKAGSRRF